MPVLDFIRRRRVVELDGRRFRVSSPTVGAVHAFLAAYAPLLGGLEWDAIRDLPLDGLASMFLLADAAAAREIVAMCVEADVPTDALPVAALAREVLRIADVPRIVESLRDEPSPGPESMSAVMAIARLSQTFGCSPVDLMDWPYLALAALRDAQAENPRQIPEAVRNAWREELARKCRAAVN